ncbi:MAG: hypothetical protein O2820_11200 [Planctomycetota bacterium]|nr:hypothetical protein [Planctomycetota bacterium]MDA1249775.1 hypothetical protein [Planctomycetota bacterium]
MARKTGGTIIATSIDLKVANSDEAFRLDLEVTDHHGKTFALRVDDPAESAELIREIFHKAGDKWPDYDVSFVVDESSGKIIGVA